METLVSWPLNTQHRAHYFNETVEASQLFATISMWLLENPVEVVSVSVERRYDDEVKDIVHSATLVYL